MTTTVNAYIKLVSASLQQVITIDEVKELLNYYKDITNKTGHQVNWDYMNHAFPYEIRETEDGKGKWIYLKSASDRYNIIIIGVNQKKIIENDIETIQSYIQIALTDSSTFGDKSKANELCKFLSKHLKAELHLFNNRIIYYYPRR